MSFQHFLVLLLLQLHVCSASRPLGFIHNASVINRNGSDSPMHHLKVEPCMEATRGVETSSGICCQIMKNTASLGTSLKLSKERATGIEDWKQKEESMVGTPHEGYGEDSGIEEDEAGEVIHVKDYHDPSGKSPIHNNKGMP